MVKWYYFGEAKKVPKYRMCQGRRCEIGRLPKWLRTYDYILEEPTWNIIEDVKDNDMSPRVNNILDSDKSCNIDGRAGTGKSHLIKMLQEEMNKRNINYETLTPTNKSAFVINGRTMHTFKSEIQFQTFSG